MAPGRRRPSVAIIDTWATAAFPSGKCSRALAEALARDHEVTVFSLAFDGPTGDGLRFVRIRAITWPTALLLPTFWLAVGVAYAWRRVRGWRPAAVIAVEGFSPVATVRYAHFCHAAYGRRAEPAPGLRGAVQRLTNRALVISEHWAYRNPTAVVAVSDGLADDLEEAYPAIAGRVAVIPNYVDLDRMQAPAEFDRAAVRRELGVDEADRLLVFVALGHFERKGLPEVMQVVADLRGEGRPVSLVVVGGFPDRIRALTGLAANTGITDHARFVGMVQDPRRYYWAADAFVLPSRYETFSFVAFEAAAAGLPLVASPVYGIRDILRDGSNGWQVEADVASVRAAVEEVATVDSEELRRRGDRARAAVAGYGREGFERRWRALLDGLIEPGAGFEARGREVP